MKIFPNSLGVVFTALCLVTVTSCARDPAPTVTDTQAKPEAIANGTAISNDIIEVIVAEQRAQGAPETPEIKEEIRKELVRRALLEQDAIKAGINKRPETLIRQNIARQNALIRDYVNDWRKNNAPTDAELQQEYEAIKASIGAQKEYHARHILLKTEQEAKTAIARLKKGAKFAELARKSLDPGSKDNGGDLGWANPAMFVPSFAEAMTKLSKGKYTTTPVKTEYGYHVILLEDVRELQHPTLDEVKADLQQRLEQKKWQAYMEQLEKNAEAK